MILLRKEYDPKNGKEFEFQRPYLEDVERRGRLNLALGVASDHEDLEERSKIIIRFHSVGNNLVMPWRVIINR